ncbi:tail fiber assembly protein [Pantoea sp. JZ2]|uniref:tail fiber assembly protein n=1 Tax=Pantoea sp. JZ2 TaxID=2654189 RepID=UPI002B469E1C|nr:tail fiber assembly protein [Pantoea sp. JZ2]WRH12199.1 tail fiber assembly protein [Pantoea sp. JZ2]
MINLKNFRRGEPQTEQQKELALSGAWFLFDEDGNEWYESQARFASDTMKIAYRENGVIAAIATNFTDVSSLFPDGMSVAEVENTAQNQRADITGGWVFDGKGISERVYTQQELTALAEAEKSRLLAAASKVIEPLQDAVDLDMATKEEAQKLKAWKKYRVLVNRVDTAVVSEVNWPEAPDGVA